MEYNIQKIKERYNAGEELEYVFFWGHQGKDGWIGKSCFSQWYPCQFEVDGQIYNCSEQFMMAEKARLFGDEAVLQKILITDNPKDIKALGREVHNFDSNKWAAVSKEVVVKGNLHKFAQNISLFSYLHDTGDKVLVEASPYDTIWGIGMKESDSGIMNPHNWRGTNKLGFALMEVRNLLLEE